MSVPQLKMRAMDAELERFARTGATLEIVEQRRRHLEMDRRFPGILAEAIRALRANGSNGHGPKAVQAAPAEPPKRRTMSAAARKRISLAQKARWRKQRKEAKAS
jgi:hypothetical protein